MKNSKLLVVCVAGLSPRILARMRASDSNLDTYLSRCQVKPLTPVFPAVTMPVQASMLTGVSPANHGCVSNSRFNRRTMNFDSWEQAATLLQAPMFWQKPEFASKRIGTVCWQFSFYNDAKYVISPAPIHARDGTTISNLYAEPEELSEILEGEFGEFPLKHYWGPFTGPPATEWIVLATNYMILDYSPDVLLTYLPLLDCTLQREKHSSKKVDEDIATLCKLLGKLLGFAQRKKYSVILLSEYGITEVDSAVNINKYLREKGHLKVRSGRGYDVIDPYYSTAWALVDHQVAQVFVRREDKIAEVAGDLEKLSGVEAVLDQKRQQKLKMATNEGAELVCVSEPRSWFNYHYWVDNAMMPPFARTVDIHSKPGYDPLELFFNRTTMSVETSNTSLVKGSHGRFPTDPQDGGVFICTEQVLPAKSHAFSAEDLPSVIAKLVL